MIIYKDYELLELFESFPHVRYDEIAGIFLYSRQDEYGFTLDMFLYVHENTCQINLFHKDLESHLVELNLHGVDSIICKENKMIIHQYDKSNN